MVDWIRTQGVNTELNQVRYQLMRDFSAEVDKELKSLSDCSYELASDFIEWLEEKVQEIA